MLIPNRAGQPARILQDADDVLFSLILGGKLRNCEYLKLRESLHLKRSAWVAELADAPDLKSPPLAFSTTSEFYQNLLKTSFKPMTGADFSPISEAKTG